MPECQAVTFELTAEASSCLLPRISQILARRDVTPHELRARCAQGRMTVRLACAALDANTRQTIEGNLRQLIGLHRLETQLHPVRQAA